MANLTVSFFDGPRSDIKGAALAGEMDEISVESLKDQIALVLNDIHVQTLIFDLAQLEFINSKGIGYLVSVHTHLSKDHRELVLAGATENVMDVISLVGLTTIIKHFETAQEALDYAGSKA